MTNSRTTLRWIFPACQNVECDKWIEGASGHMYPDDPEYWGVNIHNRDAVAKWLRSFEDGKVENKLYAIFFMFIGGSYKMLNAGATELIFEAVFEYIHDSHEPYFICDNMYCDFCEFKSLD